SYSSSSYDSDADQRVYAQNQQISNQLNDLSAEVRDLRDQNDQLRYDMQQQNRYDSQQPTQPPRSQAAPKSPANAEANSPSAVLVYRDGRRVEVNNYALVGQTVWVLTTRTARKIPLSELDLDKTARVNADRGVDFPIPNSR